MEGDMKCRFCSENESIIHLYFDCSMAKYIWGLIALVVGANCRPTLFHAFWVWAKRFLPHAKNYHMVGLAGVCWAISKARNSSCFEKKVTKSPTQIVCTISSFISFWAELQGGENKKELEDGAGVLKATALFYHPQMPGGDDLRVAAIR